MAGSGNRTTLDFKVGALPVDPRGNSIPVGGRIGTQDATGTPKVSPLALTVTVVALAVPSNAIGIDITAESDDVCYGDNTTLDATSPATDQGASLLYEGSNKIKPCGGMTSFYVRARNDNALLFFDWIYAGSAS
jgi:hypothetical protein